MVALDAQRRGNSIRTGLQLRHRGNSITSRVTFYHFFHQYLRRVSYSSFIIINLVYFSTSIYLRITLVVKTNEGTPLFSGTPSTSGITELELVGGTVAHKMLDGIMQILRSLTSFVYCLPSNFSFPRESATAAERVSCTFGSRFHHSRS